MKTVICHFYNESYLLPFWLKHHKKIFDNGIMINYQSTDDSVKIINEICPDWKIIDTKNDFFGAEAIDREVESIESSIDGWKICLNITEFILGDFSKLDTYIDNSLLIPCCVMIESDIEKSLPISSELPIMKQRRFGLSPYDSHSNFRWRRARNLHKDFITYPIGRHYENFNTNDFLILWYGWSPFNQELIERKLQIQNKMPQSDKVRGLGIQHLTDDGSLINDYNKYKELSGDIGEIIDKFYNLTFK